MLTEEQREMVVSQMPRVGFIAGKALRKYPLLNKEELFSYMHLELCKLATRFDSSKKAQFGTYVQRRLEGSVLDIVRRNTGRTSLVKPKFESLDGLQFADNRRTSSNEALDLETLKKVLSKREKEVIENHLSEDTLNESASKLGVSPALVSMIRRDGIKKMATAAGL